METFETGTILCLSYRDQGCFLIGAQSSEAPMIYLRVTKVLNKEPAQAPKSYDSYGNRFPADFALLKRKLKTCVCRPYAKNFRW